jgi:hypothetical protein
MAASTNMPQVVARNGAITFLVCLCMNMTPFCMSGSNGQMKVMRISSRKDGRLAEKRGYRMRDDASAKVADAKHVMNAGSTSFFYFRAAGFPGVNKAKGSESKMALI